eukprot:gene9417-biopygen6352
MPSSFATGGIAMSIIYLVVITGMTVYSMMMMGIAMRTTGRAELRGVRRHALWAWVELLRRGVMWLSCVGTAIAYISAAVSPLTPLLTKSDSTPSSSRRRRGSTSS